MQVGTKVELRIVTTEQAIQCFIAMPGTFKACSPCTIREQLSMVVSFHIYKRIQELAEMLQARNECKDLNFARGCSVLDEVCMES